MDIPSTLHAAAYSFCTWQQM